MHILQYGQEFRGSSVTSHDRHQRVHAAVRRRRTGDTAYAQPELDIPYLDGARAAGRHRRLHASLPTIAARQPAGGARSSSRSISRSATATTTTSARSWSDELGSAEMYYRFLNCGFRIAATGGTDNFSDVWRDPPPGADRTYAQRPGPLSLQSWLEADQGAAARSEPRARCCSSRSRAESPGEEIALAASDRRELAVKVDAVSIAPLEKLEIIVNGRVAATATPTDPQKVTFSGSVAVPAGGWIAARVVGPERRSYVDRRLRVRADQSGLCRARRQAVHVKPRTRSSCVTWWMRSGRASIPSRPAGERRPNARNSRQRSIRRGRCTTRLRSADRRLPELVGQRLAIEVHEMNVLALAPCRSCC